MDQTESKADESGKSAAALGVEDTEPTPSPRGMHESLGSKFTYVALQRFGVVLVWAATIVVFGILRPDTFLTFSNFQAMFGTQATLLILTLSLVITLSVDEFDLSVASVLALSATIIAVLNVQYGWNIWIAVLAGLSSGAVVGAINALIVVKLDIESLIVTLGMGTFLLGVALWASDSSAIGGVDQQLSDVVLFRVFSMPMSFWFSMILVVGIWYVQQFTVLGRHMLFTGSNLSVAKLAGVRVNRVRWGAYIFGGLIAAFAGVVLLGISGGIEASSTQNLLLPAFAAVFLGKAAIQPGRFNSWGAAVAIFFLITGVTGLQLLGVDAWINNIFYGSALVIAVTISDIVARRQRAH